MPQPATQLSDLPDAALEAVFHFCADSTAAVASLCLVCQRWRCVYQQSSIPLPQLSLTGPLNEQWVQQHSRKLIKVSGGECRPRRPPLTCPHCSHYSLLAFFWPLK